jgi:hypothetical protein
MSAFFASKTVRKGARKRGIGSVRASNVVAFPGKAARGFHVQTLAGKDRQIPNGKLFDSEQDRRHHEFRACFLADHGRETAATREYFPKPIRNGNGSHSGKEIARLDGQPKSVLYGFKSEIGVWLRKHSRK